MLVFAHGLEGSPDGTKIRALRAAGLSVIAPDGRGLVLADRLPAIEAAIDEARSAGPVVLGGSSYGGLAAAWLATSRARDLAGLLLAAPAFHHSEPPFAGPLFAPIGVPTILVHGSQDSVVPIEASRAYATRSRTAGAIVELREVHDDHRLDGSLDLLVACARTLLGVA